MLSKKQKEYIERNYIEMRYEDIAKELGIKKYEVDKYCSGSKLPNKYNEKDKERIEFLKNNFSKIGLANCAKALNINYSNMSRKINRYIRNGLITREELGYDNKNNYGKKIEYIIENYKEMTLIELSKGTRYSPMRVLDIMETNKEINYFESNHHLRMEKLIEDKQQEHEELVNNRIKENKDNLRIMNDYRIGDKIGKNIVIKEYPRYFLCKNEVTNIRTCISKPVMVS